VVDARMVSPCARLKQARKPALVLARLQTMPPAGRRFSSDRASKRTIRGLARDQLGAACNGRIILAELQRPVLPARIGPEVLPPGAPTARDAETDQWGEPSEARAKG
jgi:hypothetical protein